ncbi:uncharacterized protein LOC111630807 [Centruroides sculpturatus]|uniref:uncharacterized protein LOC111630807 n=1 Tax=Centruroides sculpturatus TaxID=218467 RepID=UPI000C6D689F|nr:uncharacterized protein LOC111630807 [Centruroides sculpturatus]
MYSALEPRNILVLVVYAGSLRQQGLRLDLFSSILNSWSSYYDGIVIMGDFNVHIGEVIDSHLDVASPNIFDVRRSKDLKVGTGGRQFLHWLIEHDFILLNGRTKGDFPGELTFLSKVGSSISFVWNDSKVELFGDAVSQSFQNLNFDSMPVDDFYGIILSELCSIARRLNVLIEGVEPYRRIRSPWFDGSCYIQKRARNIALSKFRRSNSPADLASFLNLKRQYNSLIKAKKRKYFCNYALQLANIRDSKTFWYRVGLKARISTSAGFTDAFSLEKGLPQGDSLSPILFICYVNDMVHVFDDLSKDFISLGNYEVHLLQFADDTVVLSTTPIYLQRKLDRLYNYSSNLGLRINLSKSKMIIFKHGGRLRKADKFFLNGRGVSIVNEVIYLKIRLSDTGSFQNYISYVKGKAFSKINVIIDILRRVKNSHMALCKKLAASLFTSSWSYGLPFWGPFCFEDIDSIELMFFRRLFYFERRIPSYAIRSELGLEFPRKRFV